MPVFASSLLHFMWAILVPVLGLVLAAALLVPYFKRSQRVKSTFVNP